MPGAPQLRCAVLPASAWTIHDTWRTAGLRGTGSHDIEIRDAVVAKEWTFDLFLGDPFARLPLFGAPLLQFSTHIGAVALGIAAGALRDLIALGGDQQAASLRQERAGRLAALPVPPGPRRGGSRRRARAAARARRRAVVAGAAGRRRAVDAATRSSRPRRGWPRRRPAWSTPATPRAAAPRSTATRRSSAGCATSTPSRSTLRCRSRCSRPRAPSGSGAAGRSGYERARRGRIPRQDGLGGGRSARTARADGPRVLDSRRIELCDPDEPDSRQPYHAGFGTFNEDDAEVKRLVRGVRRFASRAMKRLLDEYARGGPRAARRRGGGRLGRRSAEDREPAHARARARGPALPQRGRGRSRRRRPRMRAAARARPLRTRRGAVGPARERAQEGRDRARPRRRRWLARGEQGGGARGVGRAAVQTVGPSGDGR